MTVGKLLQQLNILRKKKWIKKSNNVYITVAGQESYILNGACIPSIITDKNYDFKPCVMVFETKMKDLEPITKKRVMGLKEE